MSLNSRHTPLPYLRAWRLVARLTRACLADRGRISPDILLRLERNRLASTAEIERLATALGITPDTLLAARAGSFTSIQQATVLLVLIPQAVSLALTVLNDPLGAGGTCPGGRFVG
jgi:hypothetical protein